MKTSVCLAAAMVLASVSQTAQASSTKILNGEDRLIVVNGYSTSFFWPELLQRKLDRFFDGERTVEVVSATHPGTPIAGWIDVETGEPGAPWTKVTQAIANRGDRPLIVLCQQSLQWVSGDRESGIQSADDTDRIEEGAEAIRKYVALLHASGADLVSVAMHIYKHPMEPEIGNERLALAFFAASGPVGFFPGPDVWSPTKSLYPWGFAEDKLHPGEAANEVLAHYWFQTLCEHDGVDVPEWSVEEMNRAIEHARSND